MVISESPFGNISIAYNYAVKQKFSICCKWGGGSQFPSRKSHMAVSGSGGSRGLGYAFV